MVLVLSCYGFKDFLNYIVKENFGHAELYFDATRNAYLFL